MKVIIGSVGATQNSPTTYRFADGESVKTSYFIHALAQQIKPNQVYVLLTEDARILQWDDLEPCLEGVDGVEAIGIDIPRGATEAQLWEIFDRIAESLPNNCEIILDVTQGFRSLPMLLLMSIAYLRLVKQGVSVTEVYYGAFDAVERDNPIKPVFNLTQFVTLMDWTNAVDLFNRTGNGSEFARLLKQTSHRSGEILPSENLAELASTLEQLSLALDLIRPEEVMKLCALLVNLLKKAEDEVSTRAKPFALVLQEVRREFGKLALHQTRTPEQLPEFINKMWNLVEWYYARGRVAATIILSCEWLISWHMFTNKQPFSEICDFHHRDKAGKELFNLTKKNVPEGWREVGFLWVDIRDLRNDLAHGGVLYDAIPTAKLQKDFDKLFSRIKQLRQG